MCPTAAMVLKYVGCMNWVNALKNIVTLKNKPIIKGAIMECPECGMSLERHDTLYSNINTARAKIGQHTGDVYCCEDCELCWVDDFLSGTVREWSY